MPHTRCRLVLEIGAECAQCPVMRDTLEVIGGAEVKHGPEPMLPVAGADPVAVRGCGARGGRLRIVQDRALGKAGLGASGVGKAGASGNAEHLDIEGKIALAGPLLQRLPSFTEIDLTGIAERPERAGVPPPRVLFRKSVQRVQS